MDLMLDFVDEHLEHVVFFLGGTPCLRDIFKVSGNRQPWYLGESHPILMLQFCWAAALAAKVDMLQKCPKKR